MLKAQPGIVSVQVALLAERGVVEYDDEFVAEDGTRWDSARVAEEIEDCGFDAEVVERGQSQTVELRVYGSVMSRRRAPNTLSNRRFPQSRK